MIRHNVLLLAFLVLPLATNATTLNVPGAYPTIQAAVNAARAGDDILVAAGTYRENIAFNNKGSIILHSASGAGVTTIDAGNRGSGVLIAKSVDVTVSGFTVTNGNGTPGAGIHCRKSTVTLTDNVITNNHSTGDGGGVSLVACTATLTGNTISNNSANLASNLDGGGIYTYYVQGTIANNTFQGNTGQEGGGIIINASTGAGFTLSNNLFIDNVSTGLGGAIYVNHGTAPSIIGNTIVGNSGAQAGGGIWFTGTSAPVITDNIITGNTASVGGGIDQWEQNATWSVGCNDVWGNAGGNYGGFLPDQTGINGNISADPLYCSTAVYAISATSPCAPDNSQGCGLIGAVAVGCSAGAGAGAPTAVRPTTWGAIKALGRKD